MALPDPLLWAKLESDAEAVMTDIQKLLTDGVATRPRPAVAHARQATVPVGTDSGVQWYQFVANTYARLDESLRPFSPQVRAMAVPRLSFGAADLSRLAPDDPLLADLHQTCQDVGGAIGQTQATAQSSTTETAVQVNAGALSYNDGQAQLTLGSLTAETDAAAQLQSVAQRTIELGEKYNNALPQVNAAMAQISAKVSAAGPSLTQAYSTASSEFQTLITDIESVAKEVEQIFQVVGPIVMAILALF